MREIPGAKKLGALSRKAVRLSAQSLVCTGYLEPGRRQPLVFQPTVKELDAVVWASQNRELIETELVRHGAILFRRFYLRSTHREPRHLRWTQPSARLTKGQFSTCEIPYFFTTA